MPNLTITVYDTEGDEVRIPARYEVCFSCEGTGASSRYLGAFTHEDLDDLGPEFMDDYRGGMYDRECDECRGARVIPGIDLDRATQAQVDLLESHHRAEAEYHAEVAAERRMGA